MSKEVIKPDPPDYLSGRERAIFIELCDHLEDLGIIHSIDREFITVYAQNAVRIEEDTKIINEEGILRVDKNGAVRESPAVRVRRVSSAQLMEAGKRLGVGESPPLCGEIWHRETGPHLREHPAGGRTEGEHPAAAGATGHVADIRRKPRRASTCMCA